MIRFIIAVGCVAVGLLNGYSAFHGSLEVGPLTGFNPQFRSWLSGGALWIGILMFYQMLEPK